MGPDIRNISSLLYVNSATLALMCGTNLTLLEAARWVDPALGFAVGWVSYRVALSPTYGSKVDALRTIFTPMRASRCAPLFSALIYAIHSISTPVEITAAVILLSFWDTNVKQRLFALDFSYADIRYRRVMPTWLDTLL